MTGPWFLVPSLRPRLCIPSSVGPTLISSRVQDWTSKWCLVLRSMWRKSQVQQPHGANWTQKWNTWRISKVQPLPKFDKFKRKSAEIKARKKAVQRFENSLHLLWLQDQGWAEVTLKKALETTRAIPRKQMPVWGRVPWSYFWILAGPSLPYQEQTWWSFQIVLQVLSRNFLHGGEKGKAYCRSS